MTCRTSAGSGEGRPAGTAEALRSLPEQIRRRLDQHRQWCRSDGRQGVRATLTGEDLQGLDLTGSDLTLADLDGADFTGTRLFGASLRGADLTAADLSSAQGLDGQALAGANLAHARIPEAALGELDQVQEISQIARPLFLGLLAACFYCWLSIGTVSDWELLTNATGSSLPIIQAQIPIVGFFWVAPMVLLILYFYFHFYLQRLWEGLGRLPAIFPDGIPLTRKVYPWLLAGLAGNQFHWLRTRREFHQRLETLIAIALAWWLVPMTLFLFWLRYLPRHHWGGTLYHVVLLTLACVSAVILLRLGLHTLKNYCAGGGTRQLRFAWLQSALLGLFVATLFGGVSWSAIDGLLPAPACARAAIEPPETAADRLLVFLRDTFGPLAYAGFSDEDVSRKPADYWTIPAEERLQSVRPAELSGANLRRADARQAFLVNARLRGADLAGACLIKADLRRARLDDAWLNGAYLTEARLEDAHLERTNFLESPHLRRARLTRAHLDNALFVHADLRKADLVQARLKNAVLHHADLSGANLQGADLSGAELWCSGLNGADLSGADLRGANLSGVDLRGAKLRQTRLEWACGNSETRLPRAIEIAACEQPIAPCGNH